MKYLSLFSGIGGFEYGIGSKGECVGYSEIDKYATAIYEYHYPTHTNWGDCTRIVAEELPDFDLLVGGFPCQAFSIAGKRQGFEDTRGTLFFDIARIIEAKRPKIVLLENVKGLLNHDQGKTYRVILQTLGELGYDVQWMVVNSKFFGVPQNRERTIIIGSIRGSTRPEILPFRESNSNVDERNQQDSPTCNTITSRYWKGGAGTHITRHPLRFLSRNQKNIEGDYSYTVDASHTGGIREGTNIRRLTPLECERLQAFPDNWTKKGIINGEEVDISDTQRYKTLGNAVTTNVIKTIVERIYEQI